LPPFILESNLPAFARLLMSHHDFFLLLVAGFVAGGMNALAGGGTFFSFPALLAAGLPPVTANATNAVALWPASLAASWAAREQLRPLGRYVVPLVLVSLLGGLGGGLLLLAGGDETFRRLIPWLLLAATLLFAASPWLSRLINRQHAAGGLPPHGLASHLSHSLVAIYGGYFGAGMGILQLAAFSIEGHPLLRANALKNLLSSTIYSVAVVTFVSAGRVSWTELAVLLGAASCGGYAGGALARRLPTSWLRWLVIAVGTGMTVYYFFTA
jgi:hypothetical protein